MVRPSKPGREESWGTKNMGKAGNIGVSLIGAIRVFPLSSFHLGSAREIGFHPGISLVDPVDAVSLRPSSVRPPWSTCPPPRPPRLVEEALGTGVILCELSAILTGRFRTVCKDGAALPLDKRSGRGIQSFLAHIPLGVDHIPGL